MWLDETAQPVVLDIGSFFDFTSVGPVVVEMLKPRWHRLQLFRTTQYLR